MSEQILNFATQFSLYSGFITFVLGVTGNGLNILVFTQLKLFRGNQCAFYLTVESISSFLFQFLAVSITILTSIYGDDASERSLVWCKFRYLLAQAFSLIIYYTIGFAAIDQFVSTNYRFNLRQMCTSKLAHYLTYIFICIWIVHSIIFSFAFNIQPSLGCAISDPIWVQYSTYFFYPVLIGLLPIIIASLFSILAYRNVRRIVRRQIPIVRRRFDRQMTAMVLMRVIIFVCSTLPYVIYRIYAINFPIPRTELMPYAIGRLIQAICLFCVGLNYTVKLSSYQIHIYDIFICYRSVFMFM
jgi:hypothetical protein